MQEIREEIVLYLSGAGLSTGQYVMLALLIAATLFLLAKFLKSFAIWLLRILDKQTHVYDYFDFWIDIAKRFKDMILVFVAIYVGTYVLPVSSFVGRTIDTIFLIVMTFFIVSFIQNTIFDFAKHITKFFPTQNHKKIDQTAITFLRIVVSMILWLIALIIILRAWNYDITVLLGGLGVASIIISFSAQNFLKDIFGFFTIYSDKSFSVGDYIVFDNYEGTVEEIRLRTTKIKSRSGEDLIVSNYKLTDSIIRNFNRLRKRRVSMDVLVDNTTSSEKMLKSVAEIREFFPTSCNSSTGCKENVNKDSTNKENQIEVELSYVYFRDMDSFSFIINIVYLLSNTDFKVHLAFKEQLNIQVLEIFKKNGVKLTKFRNVE